jgi:protein SCO1
VRAPDAKAYAGAVNPRPSAWPFALLLAVLTPLCGAQSYSADKPLGAAAQSRPEYLQRAGIVQNLDHPLPLHDLFTDESGRPVHLGGFFGQQPVVMALVYYKCAMMCPEVLHGLGDALATSGLRAGHDYEVVVASIDPGDKPGDEAADKSRLVRRLGGGEDTGAHVHFVTGTQASITDLAGSMGFHYVRVPGPDGRMTQFAHSSVIMVATPDGRLSKYLAGVVYQPRDLRLALLQAGHRRIGSLADLVLLYCCSYTPSQGRYTVAVLRVLGLAAGGFLLMFATALFFVARRRTPHAAI